MMSVVVSGGAAGAGAAPWSCVAPAPAAIALGEHLRAAGLDAVVTELAGSVDTSSDLSMVMATVLEAVGRSTAERSALGSSTPEPVLSKLSRTGAGRVLPLVLEHDGPYASLPENLRLALGGVTHDEHLASLAKAGATHVVPFSTGELSGSKGREVTEVRLHEEVVALAMGTGAWALDQFPSVRAALEFLTERAGTQSADPDLVSALASLEDPGLADRVERLLKALSKLGAEVDLDVTASWSGFGSTASALLSTERRVMTLFSPKGADGFRTALTTLLVGDGVLTARVGLSKQSWTFSDGAHSPVGPSLRLKF